MAQRLILHVGPHKTGSTALQQQFTENRAALAQHGIVYPRSGMMGYGHHLFVDHCRGRSTGFEVSRFREEIDGAKTVLLSSENFVVLSREEMLRVGEFFPHAQISVIYYLRNLCDAWPSHWHEMLKHGQVMPFSEYLVQAAAGVPESGRGALNQIDQLTKLSEAFCRDAVTIHGYDRIVDNGQDIAARFVSDVLRLPADRLPLRSRPQNLMLAPWQTELIRIQNLIHLQRTGKRPTGDLRAALLDLLNRERPDWLEHFQTLSKNACDEPLASDGPLVGNLQSQLVEAFGDRFVEREAVESGYLARRTRQVPRIEIPWALEPDLWKSLLDLHAQLARDLPDRTRAVEATTRR